MQELILSIFDVSTKGVSGSAFAPVSFAERASASLSAGSVWAAAGYVLLALVLAAAFLTFMALLLIYAERKIAGHFQCRIGPMRVGWHGMLQPVADAIKLLFKEDIVPERADKLLHFVAPMFAFAATMLMLLVLPMSPIFQFADVNIGVVYVSAVSGFGVLGLLIGGWSSNNKWSLLGAMRAGAQIISYELSATLALLVMVLFSGTLSLREIVESQADGWWIWRGHIISIVAFIIYVIATTAESNRTPFDIPEGESELAAGFHTEYSGLRFGFFFLAEFLNMFIIGSLGATLFLGGWMPFHIGGLDGFNHIMDMIPPGVWFTMKAAFMVFLLMWFRWTFPRLRVDQLMKLEWKILLPISFVNLFAAAAVVLFGLYLFP